MIIVAGSACPPLSWHVLDVSVSAWLHVASTLLRLIGANECVREISGFLSGSLGYIMAGIQAAEPFSSVVGRLAFTEPGMQGAWAWTS